MPKGVYTYEPGNVTEYGKDRMRFELGDTMVEGAPDTTALTDQEIQAALAAYPKSWKRAKLMLLELQERAKQWRKDYDALKKEAAAEACHVPMDAAGGRGQKPPYFHTGMQRNERTGGRW